MFWGLNSERKFLLKDSYCPGKTFPGARVSALNYFFFVSSFAACCGKAG